MPSELRDNPEARVMPQAGREAGRLLPSQDEMMAFWAKLTLAGSTAQREQEMFSGVGFSFQEAGNLYATGGMGNGADNYLTAEGIIGGVGRMGLAAMSDAKAKDQGDRQAAQQPEKPALSTPEGQQVRNASGEHVEAIKAANPNASDGSVKNWAQMTKSEQYAQAEKDGQIESFTLVDKKSSGQDQVVAARQYAAGVVLKSQEPLVDNRPIRDYGWQEKQHGQDKVIETGVAYEVGKPPQLTEQNLFERIAALPLDQQAQVIGAGIKAYTGEMTHQQFRIGVGAITGLGDGVLGLAQGAESLGKAVLSVAQFSRDVMANDPAAVETAGKAGESLGKLMVGGIRVYSAAEGYLESVGAATNVGDYGKALRDVAWLGRQMNNRWEAMSPEEKTKVVTKLAVENLGAFAAGGVINRVAKSMDITGALEELGQTAKTFGAGQREKYGKLIAGLTEELSPELATDTGIKFKWSEVARPVENAAEDLNAKMSPWFEKGESHPISAERAASIAHVDKSELKKLTKEQLREAGLAYLPKPYRQVYLDANPQYANYPGGIQVHHRVAQDVLKKYPEFFHPEEINGLDNLQGIPNRAGTHSKLSKEWNAFLKSPTRHSKADILDFATKMDGKYGSTFLP